MRHAVLGAGGVGGFLGAALARAGAEVLLIMRAESAARYGGRVTVQSALLGDFCVEIPAVGRLDRPVDVVWVATKATQLVGALDAAPPEGVGTSRVVTLLNGVDHLALLEQRHPQVIAGAIRIEAERLAPGVIRQSSPFARVEITSGEDIATDLARAGVECRVGRDATTILWDKLTFLAPMALATTAFGEPLGAVRDQPIFRACQAETVAVAQAEGALIDTGALQALTDGAPAGMRSSMQKDHAAGLPLEIDAIAGPVIRGGNRHGIATPVTQALVLLIGSADPLRRGAGPAWGRGGQVAATGGPARQDRQGPWTSG